MPHPVFGLFLFKPQPPLKLPTDGRELVSDWAEAGDQQLAAVAFAKHRGTAAQ